MEADSLCADVTARLRRSGWECSVVLLDEFRDRLQLDQIVTAEIASRRGPDRISVTDAGAMIALFISVAGRA